MSKTYNLKPRQTFAESMEDYFNKKINLKIEPTPALNYVNSIQFAQIEKENQFNLDQHADRIDEVEKEFKESKKEAKETGKSHIEVQTEKVGQKHKQQQTIGMPVASGGTQTEYFNMMTPVAQQNRRQDEAEMEREAEAERLTQIEQQRRQQSTEAMRSNLLNQPRNQAERLARERRPRPSSEDVVENTRPARARFNPDEEMPLEDEPMLDNEKRKATGNEERPKTKSKGKSTSKSKNPTAIENVPVEAIQQEEPASSSNRKPAEKRARSTTQKEKDTKRNPTEQRAKSQNPQDGDNEVDEEKVDQMKTEFKTKIEQLLYEAENKAKQHKTQPEYYKSLTTWRNKKRGYIFDQIAERGYKVDNIKFMIYEHLVKTNNLPTQFKPTDADTEDQKKKKKSDALSGVKLLTINNLIDAIIEPNFTAFSNDPSKARSRSPRPKK